MVYLSDSQAMGFTATEDKFDMVAQYQNQPDCCATH